MKASQLLWPMSLILLISPIAAFAQTAGVTGKAEAPLATVDGQPLTEDDLAPYVAGQLRPIREQEYQIKKKALDTLIGQKVMESEAKKKGLTTEKLLEQEVDAKVPEPTDVELAAIYAVQKEQIGKPYEEVKSQLQQSLKKAKVQQARQEYSNRLREQAKVSILLGPPRTQVGFDPARVRGNPKAKVMIVEFSDFECPFCGQVQGTLKSSLRSTKIMWLWPFVTCRFRIFILRRWGRRKRRAVPASRGNSGSTMTFCLPIRPWLDKPGLVTKAQKLQLEGKQFDACLASEKYKAQIATGQSGKAL